MCLRILGDNETPSQLHGCTRCPPAQKKQISMPAGFGHHEQTTFVVQPGHQDHGRWEHEHHMPCAQSIRHQGTCDRAGDELQVSVQLSDRGQHVPARNLLALAG